jgi:hypothetical protein
VSTASFCTTLLAALLTLTACGGSGGGDAPDPTPEPPFGPVDTNTGRLFPVPIAGLTYSTSTQSGTTGASGQFQYLDGESVEFRLGNTVLGTADAASLLSLFDLQAAEPLSEVSDILTALENPSAPFTAAVNIIRLLYSLDGDQDLSNGIGIDADLTTTLDAVSLDFQETPTRFAYDGSVQDLLASADRRLMPLEVSLAHQYQSASVVLTEDGVTVGRRVREGDIVALSSDVLGLVSNTEYTYDALGSLVRREQFDEAGLLTSSTAFSYNAQGLRTGRSIDDNGDGLPDFETRYEYNRAGDVVRTRQRFGPGLANERILTSTYNTLGQVVAQRVDADGDGRPETESTTEYAANGRPERIESTSEDGNSTFVITNAYDADGRLIEQTFDGLGTDIHDVLDDDPPALGRGPIDAFDPEHPYWGMPATFIAQVPFSPLYRRTTYVRDAAGRVIERRTDRDEDGTADEVARLTFEDGRPVAWDYRSQGTDDVESTATYHYSDAGYLTRVREEIAASSVDTVTRIIDTDDNGRRTRIETVTTPPSPGPRETFYRYDSEGRLTGIRYGADAEGNVQSPRDIQWDNSVRLDDSQSYQAKKRWGLPHPENPAARDRLEARTHVQEKHPPIGIEHGI